MKHKSLRKHKGTKHKGTKHKGTHAKHKNAKRNTVKHRRTRHKTAKHRRTRHKTAKHRRTRHKRTYRMRGGAEGDGVPTTIEVSGDTTKDAIGGQEADAKSANQNYGALKGGRRSSSGRRRRMRGGACNNDYVPCPPLGMVGPIPQVPDAVSSQLITNAAKISSQASANAVYDNASTK
jgi:hypothetical protein